LNPTIDTYEELHKAYLHYNAELFENKLPPCMITLSRQHDTDGYFSANQFVNMEGPDKGVTCHEITLNPMFFAIRSIPENLSVMVREMVSLLQLLEGKPPRRRYRNKEWAEMSESIGLMPSDTGKPGGKRVGDNVKTYIIDGGAFDVASSKLVDSEFKLSWVDRFPPALPPEAPATGSESDPEDYSDIASTGAQAAQTAQPGTNPLDELLEEVNLAPANGSTPEGAVPEDGVTTIPPKPVNAFKAPPEPDPNVDDAPRMKVFAQAPAAALAQIGIEPRTATKKANKSKYSCTVKACKGNVWGKPGMRVFCGGSDKKEHDPVLMVFDGAAVQEPTEEEIERF
jgi:hypothetical protein